MGGVNFTRNRAWWHTAIWDEYGQRHQYLALFPTLLLMVPFYWYGASINRELEQNYAAKMYQLDYENRRNRMTYNLIMEQFEVHCERVQDLLDGVKKDGFEKYFAYEIDEHEYDIPKDLKQYVITKEIQAEIDEYEGITKGKDFEMNYFNLPYSERMEMEKEVNRRALPYSEYKYLDKIDYKNKHPIVHVDLFPYTDPEVKEEASSEDDEDDE
jgi:hypothetical protein